MYFWNRLFLFFVCFIVRDTEKTRHSKQPPAAGCGHIINTPRRQAAARSTHSGPTKLLRRDLHTVEAGGMAGWGCQGPAGNAASCCRP